MELTRSIWHVIIKLLWGKREKHKKYALKCSIFSILNFVAHRIKFGVFELICTYELSCLVELIGWIDIAELTDWLFHIFSQLCFVDFPISFGNICETWLRQFFSLHFKSSPRRRVCSPQLKCLSFEVHDIWPTLNICAAFRWVL